MYDVSTLVKGDLLLMINTSVPNNLKKENWIEDDTLLYHNIKMKKDFSITHPVFNLKTQDGIWKYNYVYYADTQRFYFVDDITPLIGGCFELICSVDTLMSFQQSIMNCPAFESRSSHIGSGYVADSKIIFNSAPKAKTFMFSESSADGSNFNGRAYVLGVANDAKYQTIQEHIEADFPIIVETWNDENVSDTDQLFNWFEQHYRAKDMYYSWGGTGQTTVIDGRTVYQYDCAKLVDAALQTIYPTIPIANQYPATGELGRFLWRVHNISYTVPDKPNPTCQIQSCMATVSNIGGPAIIFSMADDDDTHDRDTEYFPANNSTAMEDLGITKNSVIQPDKKSNCGFGHAMYFVGHMMFHKTNHTYHRFDQVQYQTGNYYDMKGGWYFHIVGAGSNYLYFNESSHEVEEKRADGFMLLSKLTSTQKIGGIFIPDYHRWRVAWGDGGEQNE